MSEQNKKETTNNNNNTTINNLNDKNSEIKNKLFNSTKPTAPQDEPIPSKKTDYLAKIEKYINKLANQKYVKKYLFNKTDLALFIMNILSIILYKISLMSCDKDPSECTIKHGIMFYVKIGILTVISATLYSIYISITLFTRKHFLHYIYTLPVFIYFIMTYHGAETVDHGLYNSIGWITTIIILVPTILFFAIIINLILKKKIYMYNNNILYYIANNSNL